MDESSLNHQEFIRQRTALIEESKRKSNSYSKFYLLGGFVAVLLIAPVLSYLFITQNILDGSSGTSQVANVEEEVVVTPIEAQLTPVEEITGITSTPSAIPSKSR